MLWSRQIFVMAPDPLFQDLVEVSPPYHPALPPVAECVHMYYCCIVIFTVLWSRPFFVRAPDPLFSRLSSSVPTLQLYTSYRCVVCTYV